MVLLFSLIFLKVIPSHASNGGGDHVNNGGGLAEISITYALQNFPSIISTCLADPTCVGTQKEQLQLQKLLACPTPPLPSLKFDTKKNELLNDGSEWGLPFKRTKSFFIINRNYLYKNNTTINLSQLVNHLSKILLDDCKLISFYEPNSISTRLGSQIDQNNEQVTIGKDQLDLPASEWIKIRSFFSGLVIETKNSLLLLTCKDENLELCDFSLGMVGASNSSFKDLNLRQESSSGEEIQFEINGSFHSSTAREGFVLTARYKNGKPLQILLNDRELKIPKTE